MNDHNFKVRYKITGTGYAKYKDDDALVMRVIGEKIWSTHYKSIIIDIIYIIRTYMLENEYFYITLPDTIKGDKINNIWKRQSNTYLKCVATS